MSNLRTLPPLALLAILLAGPTPRAEEHPQLLPTRDVDITYDVTRPLQAKKIRERVRWLAGGHLERIDGPDRSTTILDHNANEVTLLTPARRTYSKLAGAPRRPLDPEPGTALKRGDEATVAGLRCVDWSWTEDVETHTACATADGVLLRTHCRRQDGEGGALGELWPAAARGFRGAAGLHAGARPGWHRRAVANSARQASIYCC